MAHNKRMQLKSYQIFGGGFGSDGIKFLWDFNGHPVESAAFNRRAKIRTSHEDDKISAYTTSVSSGCILSQTKSECLFCHTGKIGFNGLLSPYEIALQNVFMVVTDMDCDSYKEVKQNAREFAYMGHGEPGYSYPQIRSAIKITDKAMENLKQNVKRHLISTAGIPEMIDLLCDDIKNETFSTEVTLHVSLHSVLHRDTLMPINRTYNIDEVIKSLDRFHTITNQKPCVSIILFNNFRPNGDDQHDVQFITDEQHLDKIMSKLNKDRHRLSLCELNSNNGDNDPLSKENADKLLEYVTSKGFSAKLFASFGADAKAACGMLSGVKGKVIGEGMTRRLNKTYEVLRKIV